MEIEELKKRGICWLMSSNEAITELEFKSTSRAGPFGELFMKGPETFHGKPCVIGLSFCADQLVQIDTVFKNFPLFSLKRNIKDLVEFITLALGKPVDKDRSGRFWSYTWKDKAEVAMLGDYGEGVHLHLYHRPFWEFLEREGEGVSDKKKLQAKWKKQSTT